MAVTQNNLQALIICFLVTTHNPSICDHKQKQGYKEVIRDSGYVVAISMAKINFINQPLNWRIDLSCFFPISPYMTLNIDSSNGVQDTYHAYNPSFNKCQNNSSKINVDIFSDEKYSHISAVLISHWWQVLFPELSAHERFLIYGVNDNDFMLIHNRFASVPLDSGLLPVERELVTKHKNGSFVIETMGLSSSPF